jgi:fucose permease
MASPTRARWAITAVFGGNGMLIASLVVRTPQLKLDLDLSPAQLGLVSAVFGVSAVLAMQVAGALAARVGSGWVVRAAILVLPVGLVGIGSAPNLAALFALLLGFGAVHGLLDVTMNAHAVAVERALGRPIMNGCHAAWSIGAVVGSLAGSAAAQGGMARQAHYAVLAAVLMPAALVCGRSLLPAYADRRAGVATPARASWRAGWSRRILAFGAMGATVLTVEAAVANWSGVYLHENLGAPLGTAALGYLAFTACQTAGRLVGDRLQARGSAARLVATGTLVSAAGLTATVLSPWPALAVAGFAVAGIGLASPLPVLFGVVGHLGTSGSGAATTVARFSTMTYSGILLAPALIGWVAELVGLTWTLAGLIPLLALVASVAGPTIRPRDAAVTGDSGSPALQGAAR